MTAISTNITIRVDELGGPSSSHFYDLTDLLRHALVEKSLTALRDSYLMYVWYQQGTGHDLTIKGTPEQITEWAENLIAHVHESVQAERLRRKAAPTPEPVAAES